MSKMCISSLRTAQRNRVPVTVKSYNGVIEIKWDLLRFKFNVSHPDFPTESTVAVPRFTWGTHSQRCASVADRVISLWSYLHDYACEEDQSAAIGVWQTSDAYYDSLMRWARFVNLDLMPGYSSFEELSDDIAFGIVAHFSRYNDSLERYQGKCLNDAREFTDVFLLDGRPWGFPPHGVMAVPVFDPEQEPMFAPLI